MTCARMFTANTERLLTGVIGMDSFIPFVGMNPTIHYAASDSNSVGWRLRTLRLRRDLTLVDLANLAGLDISYLSRLERDALQNAKPKPDTINRVLDALQATSHEREAVYHVERPPLTPDEIVAQVFDLFSIEED